MLRDRDRAQEEAKAKLRRLRDDFQYNLSLIEERDAELDKYEAAVAQLTGALQGKEAEVKGLQGERLQWADREGEWRRRVRAAEEEGRTLAGERGALVRRHEGEVEVRGLCCVWCGGVKDK